MMLLSKRGLLGLAATALSFSPLRLFAQSKTGTPRVMEGPMVGAVTPSTITLWARTMGPYKVEIEYDTSLAFTAPKKSEAIEGKAEDDFTVRILLRDLSPSTTYYYRVWVNGSPDKYLPEQPCPVKTAPKVGEGSRFSVAFGSCARYAEEPEQPVWRAVNAMRPDLFFWLGDNVYIDSYHPGAYAEEYRRQRSVPSLRPLLRSVPQLAIWDDHDYGLNNHDHSNPMKDVGLTAFKQYWANPSYGLSDTPGVFFWYSYGGVDFFFLDGRYHRDANDAPDAPEKTHLGTAQTTWLQQSLKASKAPFKVLVNGGGWSSAKGANGDSWSGFMYARNALFDFIRDNNITGVILLSGDTHVAELNCIPWSESGGYDLYDLTSSPLAQRTDEGWMENSPEVRVRQVFAHDANFGFLTFDTAGDPPTLTFNVYDTRGVAAWEPLTLTTADLRNGVVSWPKKMDRLSQQRLERFKAGGPYYGPL